MKPGIEKVIRQYDRLGEGEFTRFDREGARGDLIYESELTELLEYTAPGDRVLDAGGGAGKFAIPLAERGRDVHLLDISGVQCRLAAENARAASLDSRLSVTRGDIRAVSYRADSFDAVLCIGGALSHVLDGIETALQEFAKIARDGAVLVTSVMNRSMSHKDLPHALSADGDGDVAEELESLRRRKQRREDEYEDTIGPFFKYSAAEMDSLLSESGFEPVRRRAVDRHPVFFEPLLDAAWDDADVSDALVSFERKVSALPWFEDTGNMTFHVSKLVG